MCPATRFAPYIDETLLAPDATPADIDALCERASRHGVAAVCVNPAWVYRCATRLTGSPTGVAAVVGFPFGAHETAIKAAEAALAMERGATELDVVAALGLMRAGRWRDVERDIAAVVRETKGALVKVILETGLFSPLEIVQGCHAAQAAGAGYVKTSTGFHGSGGATTAAVWLMRRTVQDTLGVKAAGGIRDCVTAEAMFDAGATRLGSSRGADLAECLGRGPRPWKELAPRAGSESAREERVR
jgi:deoxyribose-phosphate aldolase